MDMKIDYAIPAGKILREYMEARNLTDEDVAKATEHSSAYIYYVKRKSVRITPELAYKLEKVFPDVKSDFWLELECNYDKFLVNEIRRKEKENE